jgi:phage terminase large subunit-like protein
MPPTFPELIEEHGSGPKIPDLALYDLINAKETRAQVLAWHGQGLDFLKASPLAQEVRRRSKQDLYWLNAYFLWESNPESAGKPISFNKVTEATHRPICDLFVKKDDTKSIADQDPVFKQRMILYPRGGLKSTCDVGDAVQWILNFPEIRILFLTADDDLGAGFVDLAKSHFVIRTYAPSLLNLYFPEYSVDEKHLGPAYQFTCPIWAAKQIRRIEPTIQASTVESTLSGPHYEVIKADDTVSNRNSQSDEQCKKAIKNYHVNIKMLMSYGYLDIIGTRYADEDLYGEELDKNVGTMVTLSGMGLPDPRPWELTINESTGKKILVGTGWRWTDEATRLIAEGQLSETALEEKHYHILFPELLPYSVLRKMQLEDEFSFESQINQNPRPKSHVIFDRPLLTRCTVPFSAIPTGGPICVVWDFAFSQQKGRDYSTAAVGIFNDKGQLFIIDLVRQRFSPTGLASKFVDLVQHWHPSIVAVEKASGSDFLEPAIIAEALRRNKQYVLDACKSTDWFKPDQEKDAKKNRIKALHPLMTSDSLFFVAHLPYLEALYQEFERCLVSRRHHDDIPDVIAQMRRYMPRMSVMISKREIPTWSRDDAAWNLIFEEDCDAFGRPGFGFRAPSILPVPVDTGIPADTPTPELHSLLGAGIIG